MKGDKIRANYIEGQAMEKQENKEERDDKTDGGRKVKEEKNEQWKEAALLGLFSAMLPNLPPKSCVALEAL